MLKKLSFEYKITAIYLLLGGLWIVFSDKFLNLFFSDSESLTRAQTYKGWFYVIITAILFYSYLKNHLVKIRNAEQKARQSDQLKTAFLQNISHEIRTPMNGIIGFAGLLDDANLTESQRREYLEIITKSSGQLLEIVNEVLDISMIETGSISTIEVRTDLNHLMDEIYKSYRHLIKKGIDFSLLKGVTETDCIVRSDPGKIRQVLSNLINNAIKFTDTGHITFGYNLKQSNIEFFVEDTGIGISPEFQETIFGRFNKPQIQTSRFYEGVGLGLSICKGIVDLMKGQIWLQSESGVGTTFYFTIPFISDENIITQKHEEVNHVNEIQISSLLVVEDEESNFRYIKELLKLTGIEILHAVNGKIAVEMCKANPQIDMVLMDIKMPEMDGYEATRLIREFRPDLPVIAQTAYALVNERTLAFDAGCNEYIAKPFKRDEFLEIINKVKR